MATGGLTPIRGNDSYVACGKQAAWGTAVPPTLFPIWLQGSEWGPEVKTASEMQGDASPHKAFLYKTGQYGIVKIVEYARPIGAGYALQGLLGTGSDTYTAPTQTGTLSSAILAGATSFSTALNLGATGQLPMNFTPGLASLVYETQTVDLTSKTGTGPFTYSLVAGAKFLYAHGATDAISSAANHSLTRQLLTYDPYTIEFGWGYKAGTPSQIWRLQDAVCTDLTITYDARKPVKFEHTWYGALTKLQASATTPINLEGMNIVGRAGSPFMYYQNNGTFLVDGAATGNAAQIASLKLTMKNSTNPEEFITEGLNPTYFQLGNLDTTVQASVILQNFNQFNELYYGAQTIATGASDSVLVGYGSLGVTLTSDALNAFGMTLANAGYTGGRPVPSLDGKSLIQPLQLTAIANKATPNPVTFTLANSQASAF